MRDKNMVKAELLRKIELLKAESPIGTAQHYLTGNADGLRSAFEHLLLRQHQMLEILEAMIDSSDEQPIRRVG